MGMGRFLEVLAAAVDAYVHGSQCHIVMDPQVPVPVVGIVKDASQPVQLVGYADAEAQKTASHNNHSIPSYVLTASLGAALALVITRLLR